jgi:hypothetical protein
MEVFSDLYEHGIKVASVISDGYPPQIAALNFKNQYSIQSIFYDKLSKIIFIQCIAHKLNNTIKFVYRECQVFTDILNSSRNLAM